VGWGLEFNLQAASVSEPITVDPPTQNAFAGPAQFRSNRALVLRLIYSATIRKSISDRAESDRAETIAPVLLGAQSSGLRGPLEADDIDAGFPVVPRLEHPRFLAPRCFLDVLKKNTYGHLSSWRTTYSHLRSRRLSGLRKGSGKVGQNLVKSRWRQEIAIEARGCKSLIMKCRGRDSNPHGLLGQRILRPKEFQPDLIRTNYLLIVPLSRDRFSVDGSPEILWVTFHRPGPKSAEPARSLPLKIHK